MQPEEDTKSPAIRVSVNDTTSPEKDINELLATVIKNVTDNNNTECDEDPEYAKIIEETYDNSTTPPKSCCPNHSKTKVYYPSLIEEDNISNLSNDTTNHKWKAILILLKSHHNLTQAIINLIEDK